jgi:hypothetical protein
MQDTPIFDAVLEAIKPTEAQQQRWAAGRALRDERLRASEIEDAARWKGDRESLGALLQRIAGGALVGPGAAAGMPPSGPSLGLLEQLLNARRVANPRQSPTPPPIIGIRG